MKRQRRSCAFGSSGGLLILISISWLLAACNRSAETVQSAGAAYNQLGLLIELGRSDCVQIGVPVPIQFTVKNYARSPITIESRDKPVMDIYIRMTNLSREPISWSSENPSQVVHRLVWQPGDSKSIEMTWTVPAGEYPPGQTISIDGVLSEDQTQSQTGGQAASLDVCLGSHFAQ